MSSIVIALPKIEDARKIRSVLECHGLAVASVCSTASNALSSASELGNGVLIRSLAFIGISTDRIDGGTSHITLADARSSISKSFGIHSARSR